MKLTRIATTVQDRDAAAAFYHDVLGMPVRHSPLHTVVSIGASELVLTTDPDADARGLHLALDVPADRLDLAADWLDSHIGRIVLDGEDTFDGPAGWNSRSVYFLGPENSILEFIGRRDLKLEPGSGAFHPSEVIGISEVGVAVDSVPLSVDVLTTEAGLPRFGSGSDTFTPVGDASGLLIMVQTGRVWFPTESQRALPVPLHIEARGGVPGVYPLSPDATLTIR
ncbi:VOC family protein [Mycetocola sp. JXN-3]|uniref:VOC family protein n=1 Tax=Mycetocola sp. JXN-3 TaxID=2116510 RepID=UPI00165D0000|nr:VOC family protein [Mycetocola sp. JXN-3]